MSQKFYVYKHAKNLYNMRLKKQSTVLVVF